MKKLSQIGYIKKALSLHKRNPDAAIKICADDETIADYGWTEHEITNVKLANWIEIDEHIYTDEDRAKSEIADVLYGFDTSMPGVGDEEFQEMVDKYYQEHAIKAICIFTSAP